MGLIVQYIKHLPDVHTERDGGIAVARWGRSFLPDVSLGPQPVGFNLIYEEGEGADHYVRMSIWVEENYLQHRAGLEGRSSPTADDVGVTIRVGRMDPGGLYRWVYHKEYWVPSLDRLDELRPQVENEMERLHIFMIENLLPKRVNFKLSWHVHNVEEPIAPIFFLDAMEDSFGPIEPHPTQRSFCFNLHFTHYDGTVLPSEPAVDERRFWRYDLEHAIERHVEKACEPREGYCARPASSVIPYLTKGFGIFFDERLELFDSGEWPITYLCPLEIEPPSADTLLLGAPDRLMLPFRVTGMDGMPLPGVSMEVTRGVPAELGQVTPERTLTNSLGEPEGLALTAREDAPDDLAD